MTRKNEMDASDMMVASERISTSLLNNHINFLFGDIDVYNTEEIIKWIIYENTIDEPDKILTLYVNSNGGDLTATFALIDVMAKSKYPIRTIGIGSIASGAFLIFAAGTKGQRVIAKNTSIMTHQYTSGIVAKQHDLEAFVGEMGHINDRLIGFLETCTNLKPKDIKLKLIPPSDVYLTPQDLIDMGIADVIS